MRATAPRYLCMLISTLCFFPLFAIAQESFFVSGAAGVWDVTVNPDRHYGRADGPPGPATPVFGVRGSPIDPWAVGGRITVTYVSGTPLAGANGTALGNGGLGVPGWAPIVAPCTSSPGCYTGEPETYLEQLIGAFIDKKGVVVGTPFVMNNLWTGIIPEGATQLLMGFNDDYYADNGDGIFVDVEYDFCSVYGGTGVRRSNESGIARSKSFGQSIMNYQQYNEVRHSIEKCGRREETSAECSVKSDATTILANLRAASGDLVAAMRSQHITSVIDAYKTGFSLDNYPLALKFVLSAEHFASNKPKTEVAGPIERLVCGWIGNDRPAMAASWWQCSVDDAKATLISSGFHSTNQLFGGDWTRPQSFAPSICNTGSFRDHAILSSYGNIGFGVQDYVDFVPRGEPNPDLFTYVWPYEEWPLYVYRWHVRH
jgi:hypothetical protein